MENISINKINHLEINGCDSIDLIKKYGSPLYVIDQSIVENRCQKLNKIMSKYFNKYRIMYASKALNTMAILKLVTKNNLGIDTVSIGELYTALKANIKSNLIELHGNSKNYDEIKMAIDNNIYSIIVDNFDELNIIKEISKKEKKEVYVSIRLRPNIDVHTNKKVKTAILDCKFGFGLDEVIDVINIINNSKYLKLRGLHCHLGSQIFESEPYKILIETLMNLAVKIKNKLGIIIEEFNCGGGFGVKYLEDDNVINIEDILKEMSTTLNNLCNKYKYPIPCITIEPGRYIIGNAGYTLYTVNAIKEIKNIRDYCMVDGGMFENIRPMLYDAKYSFDCANKMNEEKKYLYTIAGRCCETGDIIAKDIYLPKLSVGDTLVCYITGAYGYSMASNYNRNLVPEMILVNKGKSNTIIKRETLDDLIKNDVIPKNI